MASVVLDRVWVHLASDLNSHVTFFSADWSDNRSARGEVRTYANGRRRVIRRAGTSRQIGFTAKVLTRVQVDTLVSWAGRVVLVRDTKGRKVYCTFFTVDVGDFVDGSHEVTVAATEVTFSEAV